MATTTPVFPSSAADVGALERLQPVGPSHDDVRRYSRARRNVLPRADHVTAVAGGWAHDVVLRSDAPVEVALWCPGDRPYPELEATAGRGGSPRGAGLPDLRADPGADPARATAPALLSVVRLPRWRAGAGARPARRLRCWSPTASSTPATSARLVRTADACAVDALVLTRATARVTHPKAFAASRGTVLTTPVLEYADGGGRRGRTWPPPASRRTSPTRPGRRRTATRGWAPGRTAVVVGSEGEGVADEWRTRA